MTSSKDHALCSWELAALLSEDGKLGFYETIRSKAAYPEGEAPATFPAVMEHFCKKLDGGRHNRLIREAISYIEGFSLSGEEYRSATLATGSLATIPYFSRFVTTNWDPFIERSLDVLVPVIEDRDLAFWDDRKKQVLKIHGCITRPYSIVAAGDGCIASPSWAGGDTYTILLTR